MAPPLLPTLKHIEGETHTSFAARLAALHKSSPRDFYSDLGLRWPFLCTGYPEQLDQLAWLTGNDLNQLSLYCPSKIGRGRYRVGKTISTTGAFRRAQVRVCPRCVVDAFERSGRSGLFQLLEWSVCCLYRCQQHGIGLMALPLARTSHETYDVVAQVLQHLPAIREAADGAMLFDPTDFETYVRHRIWTGAQDDWLRGLDLTQLHRACLSLGVMLAGMPEDDIGRIPQHLQREACQLGLTGLSGGPERLREDIERLRTTSGRSRPNAASDLGVFYRWLQSNHAVPAVADIVTFVREHILKTYPITHKGRILGRSPEAISCITFDQARKRTGLGVALTKRVLCHLQKRPFEDAQGITEINLIDLERVQNFWSELCNLKQASAMLALQPKQVKDLMRLGALRTVRFGSALRYLRRSDVEDCIADVEKMPRLDTNIGFVPLKDFCRLKGIPLAKVLAEWRFGHLDGFVRRIKGAGLHQIAIGSDAMCDRRTVFLTRDLTLRETAAYLRISVISIRKLRDAGLLAQIQKRNPDTNHQRNYICQASIEDFERRFATLGQVSERCQVAPIHLARRLDRDGIATINHVDGMVRVYRKHQIPTNIEAAL